MDKPDSDDQIKKLKNLEEKLKLKLDSQEIKDPEDLKFEIKRAEKEMMELRREGKPKRAAEKEKFFQTLKSFQSINKKIEILKGSTTLTDYREKKLQLRLKKFEKLKKEELKKEIKKVEQNISELMGEKNFKKVKKETIFLENLKQLQKKSDQLLENTLGKEENKNLNASQIFYTQGSQAEFSENYNIPGTLEELKKNLDNGFKDCEVKTLEELDNEIKKLRKDISDLRSSNRPKKAEEYMKRLKKFEELQVIAEKLNTLKEENPTIISPRQNLNLAREQKIADFKIEPLENIYEIKEHTETTFGDNDNYDDNKIETKPETDEKENFIDMFKTSLSMPLCFERSLLRILFYASVKLNKISDFSDLKVPNNLEKEIENEMTFLRERYEVEKIDSFLDASDFLEKCQSNIKAENWELIVSQVRRTLKKIRSLDIQELNRFASKVDVAAELIKDKRIILFLGGTGSGKSTTIHFLAGSEMKEVNINGLRHITPATIINPHLKDVKTSPFAESETRYITSVPVNLSDLGGYNKGSIILCDSPGFEDTNGPEIDIANGIAILRALKKCKSVKPVVLVSFKSLGDRMTGLKDLAHVLVGMIPAMKDYLYAFSYLFTKYPNNEKDRIYASLESTRNKMRPEEEADEGFLNFFIDMLRKTKKGTDVIDPINGHRGIILEKLAKSPPIDNPNEVFQFSITEKSKNALREQIRRHQLSIMSAVKYFDYDFINYKLEELKFLHELLGQGYINQVYSECVSDLSKYFMETYKAKQASLNRCLKKENKLELEDLEEYKRHIQTVKKFEESKNTHLRGKFIQSAKLSENLNSQVEIMISNFNQSEINDPLKKKILDKLKLVAFAFPDINNQYQNLCKKLMHEFEDLLISLQKSVKACSFYESSLHLTRIENLIFILQDHFSEEIKMKRTKINKIFEDWIQDSANELTTILAKESPYHRDIDAIVDNLSSIESARKVCIISESIEKVYGPIREQILAHFENLCENIAAIFGNGEEISIEKFSKTKVLMEEMVLIRKIPGIELRTDESFYSTLGMLSTSIQKFRLNVKQNLILISELEENINYYKMADELSIIRSTQWIEDLKFGTCIENVYENAEKRITLYINEIEKYMIEVDLSRDSYDNIKSASNLVFKVQKLEPLIRLFQTLTAVSMNIIKIFETKIQNNFEDLQNKYLVHDEKREEFLSRNDYEDIEKSFNYLETCHSLKINEKEASRVLFDLADILKKYRNSIEKKIENCYKFIILFESNPEKNEKSLVDAAQDLFEALEIILELKEKHTELYRRFDPDDIIIESWKKQLLEFYMKLSGKIEESFTREDNQHMRDNILIAKSLCILDDFLNEKRFIEIYQRHRAQSLTLATDSIKTAFDAMQNHDYKRLQKEIIKFGNSVLSKNDITKIMDCVSENLNDEIRETLTKINNFFVWGTHNNLEQIKSQLQEIQEAKESLAGVLSMRVDFKDFEFRLGKIIIKNLSSYSQRISNLISNYNFSEAHKLKVFVNSVVENLLRYTDQNFSLLEIQQNEEKALAGIIEQYSILDLGAYHHSPPKNLFEKLSNIEDDQGTYSLASEKLKSRISDKIWKEIFELKSKKLSVKDNQRLVRLQNALNYLPNSLQQTFSSELKTLRHNLNLDLENHMKELSNVIQSKNLQEISNFIRKCKQSGQTESIQTVRDNLISNIKGMKKSLDRDIMERDTEKILTSFQAITAYKLHLGSLIEEIIPLCQSIEDQLGKKVDEVFSSCLDQISTSKCEQSIPENTGLFEKDWVFLIGIVGLKKNNHNQLLRDSEAKVSQLDKKLSQYFSDLQIKYRNALNIPNVDQLKIYLQKLKKWDEIFSQIFKFVPDFNNNLRDKQEIFVFKSLNEAKLYSKIIEEIESRFKTLKSDILFDIELIDNESKLKIQQFKNFYTNLNSKFSALSQAKELKEHNFDFDSDRISEECQKSLENKINKVFSFLERFIDDLLNEKILSQDSMKFKFNSESLFSLDKYMESVKFSIIKQRFGDFQQNALNKANNLADLTSINSDANKIAHKLICMRAIAANMPLLETKINRKIDQVLYSYIKKNPHVISIHELVTVLKKFKRPSLSNSILKHQSFQGYYLSLFNTKAEKYKIDYVLNKIKGEQLDKTILEKRYAEFKDSFDSQIFYYFKYNSKIERLISEIKKLTANIKHSPNGIKFDANIKAEIPRLVARIFILWAYKKANYSLENNNYINESLDLFQPHPAQVISIFRMFGIGDLKEELKNTAIEIKACEGKSIVIGVAACLFALLGFEVTCGFRNIFISQQRLKKIELLFDTLELSSFIHYSTFANIIQENLSQNEESKDLVPYRPKILLTEELEFLASKDFYGEVYVHSINLQDITISNLLDIIWSKRSCNLSIQELKLTKEYKACCQKYENMEFEIEEALLEILSYLNIYINSFNSDEYNVNDDQIIYLNEDYSSNDLYHKYRILFTHYHENGKGKITEKSLESKKFLAIKSNSFPNCDISQKFEFIIGAAGTLESLNISQRLVIMYDYKIKGFTYIPLMFGQSNLKFSPDHDILITAKDSHFIDIATHIQEKISRSGGVRTCILVFFANTKTMMEFYNSEKVQMLLEDKPVFVTKEMPPEEQKNIIDQAAISGQITLLTREFCRGIDFQCVDSIVSENGGIHVVQTFFSEDLSEENQIKGRTAKHGEQGSYSMVLADSDLKKLMSEEEIQRIKDDFQKVTGNNKYDFLNKKRNEYIKMKYESISESLNEIRKSTNRRNNHRTSNIAQNRSFSIEKSARDNQNIKRMSSNIHKF